MQRQLALCLTLVVIAHAAVEAAAESPVGTGFAYQGKIERNGWPLNDTADLEFALFDADVEGSQIGDFLAFNDVEVVDGLITVTLDFGAEAFGEEARWLEVAIRSPAGEGEFTVLAPRQPLTPTPYALFALNGVEGPPGPPGEDGADSLWEDDGTNMFFTTGNVGIGTDAPEAKMEVLTDSGDGIRAETSGDFNSAIRGVSDGLIAAGVVGQTLHDSGFGVLGAALAQTGGGIGVQGSSLAPEGTGVLARSVHNSGRSFGLRSSVRSPNGYAGYFEGGRNFFEGNVGIGVDIPEADLHIRGDESLGSILLTPGVANSNAQLFMAEQQSTSFGMIMRYDGGANQLHFIAQSSGEETAPLVSINRSSAGNVGIGTITPGAKLDVAGDIHAAGSIFVDTAGSFEIAHTNNTGLEIDPAANAVHIETDNGRVLTATAAGSVGIGTDAPQQLLHVKDGDAGVAPNADARLVLERNGNNFVNLLTPNANASGILFANPTDGSAAGGVLYNASNSPNGLQFRTNGNVAKMTIADDGDVGIGTTDPKTELDIASRDEVGTITVQPNSAGNITELVLAEDINADFAMITRYDGDVNQLHFIARQSGEETAPLVSINRSSAGNVGIGTTSPQGKLHVGGNMFVDGAIETPVRNHRRIIPPTAFVPNHAAVLNSLDDDFFITSNSSAAKAFAQLPMPDGAIITAVSARVVDVSDSFNISIVLYRQAFAGTPVELRRVNSSGRPGQTLLEFTGSFPLDRENFAYFLGYRFNGNSEGALQGFEVDVAYTTETIE